MIFKQLYTTIKFIFLSNKINIKYILLIIYIVSSSIGIIWFIELNFLKNNIYKNIDFYLFDFILFDFLLRTLFQSISLYNVNLFLVLPRGKYLLFYMIFIKSLVHPINFLWLFVYQISSGLIISLYSFPLAIIGLLVLLLIFSASLIISLILKYYYYNYKFFKVIFISFFILILYFDIFNIEIYIYNNFFNIFHLIIILILNFILFYILKIFLFKRSYSFFNIYSQTKNKKVKKFKNTLKITLLAIQFLQIFRNKRLYHLLWQVSLIIVFCIYYIIANKHLPEGILAIYYLILNTSFCYTFGQYLFSMDSSICASIWTKKINYYKYMYNKLLFLIFLLLLPLLIQMPFFVFDYLDKWISISLSISLLAISIPLIYISSINHTKKMELNQSPFGSWGSVNIFHSLISMVYIFIPLIFFYIFRIFFVKEISALLLGLISIFSMIFVYFYLYKTISIYFLRYKYKIYPKYLK